MHFDTYVKNTECFSKTSFQPSPFMKTFKFLRKLTLNITCPWFFYFYATVTCYSMASTFHKVQYKFKPRFKLNLKLRQNFLPFRWIKHGLIHSPSVHSSTGFNLLDSAAVCLCVGWGELGWVSLYVCHVQYMLDCVTT